MQQLENIDPKKAPVYLKADDNGNAQTSLGTQIAGEDIPNDILKTESRVNYSNISASALIKSGIGKISGIFVASASATPTIKIWNNTAGSGDVIINTFTPTAGTMYDFGAMVVFNVGCYITISGTVDCTVFYK